MAYGRSRGTGEGPGIGFVRWRHLEVSGLVDCEESVPVVMISVKNHQESGLGGQHEETHLSWHHPSPSPTSSESK